MVPLKEDIYPDKTVNLVYIVISVLQTMGVGKKIRKKLYISGISQPPVLRIGANNECSQVCFCFFGDSELVSFFMSQYKRIFHGKDEPVYMDLVEKRTKIPTDT
jgi:hypothetical protein